MTNDSKKTPEIVVGILKRGSEVLIVERQTVEAGTNHALLRWVFPGGNIEPGETAEEALHREVLEETGYSIHATRCLDVRQHPEFPVIIRYYACVLDSASAVTFRTSEIREVQWAPIQKLSSYLTSSLNPIVSTYLETT